MVGLEWWLAYIHRQPYRTIQSIVRLNFHVARFFRKKANVFINHWYMSLSVNCLAAESRIAWTSTDTTSTTNVSSPASRLWTKRLKYLPHYKSPTALSHMHHLTCGISFLLYSSQPHSVHCPPGSPHPAHITSSLSITPLAFHSRLKTHLFHKSFPP